MERQLSRKQKRPYLFFMNRKNKAAYTPQGPPSHQIWDIGFTGTVPNEMAGALTPVIRGASLLHALRASYLFNYLPNEMTAQARALGVTDPPKLMKEIHVNRLRPAVALTPVIRGASLLPRPGVIFIYLFTQLQVEGVWLEVGGVAGVVAFLRSGLVVSAGFCVSRASRFLPRPLGWACRLTGFCLSWSGYGWSLVFDLVWAGGQ
eukprot:jgi/Chrzof1/5185/Cz15g15090.t1